jgi:hypothetical protein
LANLALKYWSKSLLVPQSRTSTYSCALDHFLSQDYVGFLVIFLPQLEHSLRIAYGAANDCIQQILSAEDDVVYITMKDLVVPFIEPKNFPILFEEFRGIEYFFLFFFIFFSQF